MTKLLVTGANGQVGSEIREISGIYPEYEITYMDRSIVDMADTKAIERYFEDKTFDALINCAAYTAVDKAESQPDLADAINSRAVETLAKIAKAKKMSLIHISTDYVFNGQNYRPYMESDSTDPQGVYGRSKRDGEEAIVSVAPANTIIIRTSWVYSSFGNNFLKTMLRLGNEKERIGVIFDQVGTPTYARDLAKMILDILPNIQNGHPEIYHYSNEGVASWYDFAQAIFELSGIQCQVNPITTDQYPTPATRPYYSLLNKNKIKQKYNIDIPYWKDSLEKCIALLGEKE
ncbi:MAG: dTDP-4-dehydrorhamnose reductase [Sulfuricurvum sp.]|jgi:dTDP-4-dehydrorhamnose reductase|uniref:dTDP-4-dehydrorhamnose reductase n=1 Tax=Sulfuricurvum sp. TaxID=2025608 RepID=UPI0025CF2BB5|nr:dTDP-4-dehydrorhamnose reductase [Sulfuricurvum sp.]MCK9372266.1 dTDP-4-dehydrorhamnose reductase [Sulfuricurvum sp.]